MFDDYEYQWYPVARDRRLYAAVLARALEDLLFGTGHETERALDWFKDAGSIEDTYLSYGFIRDALDLSASRIFFIETAIEKAEYRKIRIRELPKAERKGRGLFSPDGYRKCRRRTLAA